MTLTYNLLSVNSYTIMNTNSRTIVYNYIGRYGHKL